MGDRERYIIQNCPAYCYLGKECHNEEGRYGVSCCEVTDCVLKQVVELCKGSIRENERDIYRAGRMSLAINILGLLDIEEVE